MRPIVAATGLLFTMQVCGVAQTEVRFEVASVKLTPQPYGKFEMHTDPGRIAWSVPVRTLIELAYDVKSYQVEGNAEALAVRCDITATLPKEANRSQLPLMFQSLLRERFGLSFHRDRKTMPVYELVASGDNSKLHRAQEQASQVAMKPVRGGRELTGRAGMTELASHLSHWLDHPLVDKTGIEGVYDFDLKWSGFEYESATPAPGFDGIAASYDLDHASIFSELRDKLGLKVRGGKGPVEVLIVDRLERVPTDN